MSSDEFGQKNINPLTRGLLCKHLSVSLLSQGITWFPPLVLIFREYDLRLGDLTSLIMTTLLQNEIDLLSDGEIDGEIEILTPPPRTPESIVVVTTDEEDEARNMYR